MGGQIGAQSKEQVGGQIGAQSKEQVGGWHIEASREASLVGRAYIGGLDSPPALMGPGQPTMGQGRPTQGLPPVRTQGAWGQHLSECEVPGLDDAVVPCRTGLGGSTGQQVDSIGPALGCSTGVQHWRAALGGSTA